MQNDTENGKPKVVVLFKPGNRKAYSDRYTKIQGFAYPAEFYNPDYSKQTPPDSVKDYRRTLYWNPNLMLDKDGKATITLYIITRARHKSAWMPPDKPQTAHCCGGNERLTMSEWTNNFNFVLFIAVSSPGHTASLCYRVTDPYNQKQRITYSP